MADEPKHSNSNQSDSADRGFFDLPDFGALARRFGGWCRANPAGVALLVLLLGLVAYYYFGVKAFLGLSLTPAQWMASGWNEENDQTHCYAVIPIAIFLVLLRWRDLQAAPKTPSNAGLWWLAAGIFMMVAAVRCVEGRYSIIALSLLSFGAVMFLFGRQVARIVAFPCAFLLFMIPMGVLVQGTAQLQPMVAKAVAVLSTLVGIPVHTGGTKLFSSDGKFEALEVAGGCSGIRSLMAMMMLAALYGYLVMRTPWRGFLLFGCSIFFALIGNFVRVFSVVLVARFVGPAAANQYHDWSGFVFFPVAVFAMVGVGNLLNRDWGQSRAVAAKGPPPAATGPEAAAPAAPVAEPPAKPESSKPEATYDY
jgi:exosortase